MSLKPQDVLVALKLAIAHEPPSYAELGRQLGLSASQAHSAVQRAIESGLISKDRSANQKALLEFLVHGLKYVFPARRGPVRRGVPTAHSAPPLSDLFNDGDLPLVWPHPSGLVRGETLEPIYKSAPDAALADPGLHQALALVDSIRAGRARERNLAVEHLQELFEHAPA